MKQFIDLMNVDIAPSERDIMLLWKRRKYKDPTPSLSLGECVELIIAFSYNLHSEFSDGRFFNHILINGESVLAWDGDELIDTLFYEAQTQIKKRLASSRILPQS